MSQLDEVITGLILGYPRDLFRVVVTVADEDCDAMKMPRGTKAEAFGTGWFMQSKAILLLARGKLKKDLLHKLFNEAEGDFPAAYLRDHHRGIQNSRGGWQRT